MTNPAPSLVILNGIFQCPSHVGSLVHPSEGAAIYVAQRLSHLVGREVDLAVHHFPPGGRLEESAGGGSCLLGECCKAHREDPAYLFSQKLFGTLSWVEDTLRVGQTPVDFSSLDGHFGQLIVFSLPANQDASLEDLLEEVSSMTDLLSSLRGSLKAST